VKALVIIVLLALVMFSGVAQAVDPLRCDVWLETENVLMWAACRVAGWIAVNQDTELEYYYGIVV